MNDYTEKVIYWIHHHEYSRQHWETVAKEMLAEDNGDRSISEPRLAQVIREFHMKFQDAVVKPGNVLYDFIDMAYIEVDWQAVAVDCYDKFTSIP